MSKNGYSDAHSAAIPLAGFTSMQYGFSTARRRLLDIRQFASEYQPYQSLLLGWAVLLRAVPDLHPDFRTLSAILFAHAFSIHRSFLAHAYYKGRRSEPNKADKDIFRICRQPSRNACNACVSIGIMVLSVIYQASLCSIPYFVLRAFGGTMAWLPCFITTVAIYATVTFIPTPGNAGAAEGSFFAVFSALSSGYVFWAMMAWRFFVYYIFIILGAFIYISRWLGIKTKRRSSHARAEPTCQIKS